MWWISKEGERVHLWEWLKVKGATLQMPPFPLTLFDNFQIKEKISEIVRWLKGTLNMCRCRMEHNILAEMHAIMDLQVEKHLKNAWKSTQRCARFTCIDCIQCIDCIDTRDCGDCRLYRLQRLHRLQRLYRQSPATKNISQFLCEIKSHKKNCEIFSFCNLLCWSM